MQAGDPRADPAIVDLIELAGLWLAAEDFPALQRTLDRLQDELEQRYPSDEEFVARFRVLKELIGKEPLEDLRRRYRRATVG